MRSFCNAQCLNPAILNCVNPGDRLSPGKEKDYGFELSGFEA
jgi:hypothetical protein